MQLSYRYLVIVNGAALLALFPMPALAHCPLCTAGAGIVAVGAYGIGAKAITIGVGLGALATAMGLWLGRLIKRQFVPRQPVIIAALSWVLTLYPLRLLFADYASWYINWSGDYGSLLNRTYYVNLFVVGAAIGTAVVIAAPAASRLLTRLRHGRMLPFQGVILSLLLIMAASVLVQFI